MIFSIWLGNLYGLSQKSNSQRWDTLTYSRRRMGVTRGWVRRGGRLEQGRSLTVSLDPALFMLVRTGLPSFPTSSILGIASSPENLLPTTYQFPRTILHQFCTGQQSISSFLIAPCFPPGDRGLSWEKRQSSKERLYTNPTWYRPYH